MVAFGSGRTSVAIREASLDEHGSGISEQGTTGQEHSLTSQGEGIQGGMTVWKPRPHSAGSVCCVRVGGLRSGLSVGRKVRQVSKSQSCAYWPKYGRHRGQLTGAGQVSGAPAPAVKCPLWLMPDHRAPTRLGTHSSLILYSCSRSTSLGKCVPPAIPEIRHQAKQRGVTRQQCSSTEYPYCHPSRHPDCCHEGSPPASLPPRLASSWCNARPTLGQHRHRADFNGRDEIPAATTGQP